jgi:uncharacterized membrane protein YeaQ/YmgE (transglycosylase-associated protein family)
MVPIAVTPNVITINLDWQTILVWAFVGLVGGFLASHVMLGHGMGIFGDMVIGIIGGVGANLLANFFNVHFTVANHPIISQIIIAFFGAVVLLMVLRLFGMGRGWSRSRAY